MPLAARNVFARAGLLLLFLAISAIAWAQSGDVMAEGSKALDAKNYNAAVELFKKAVAQNPKDYAAHFQLGLAYSLLDKFDQAAPEFKTSQALHPGLYDTDFNLGNCLFRLHDFPGAAAAFERALQEKPKDFKAAYFLGMSKLETRDFAGSAAAFTTAVAANPAVPGAELGLAHSLAAEDHLDESEPHFRRAAQLDPAYKPDLLALGELYEKKGDKEKAIAIYREFPDDAGAQEHMGSLLAQTGQAASAITALESAVAKSPTAANRIALAQAYVQTKQPDKAMPLVAKAIEMQPNDYQLRMYYGILLRDQRKFPDAAAQFQAASKLKADALQPWNELAGVYVVSEQYAQALAALDRVRALGGDKPFLDYLRAISYDHLHQLKEALNAYNKFLAESRDQSPDEEFKARQRVRIIGHELSGK